MHISTYDWGKTKNQKWQGPADQLVAFPGNLLKPRSSNQHGRGSFHLSSHCQGSPEPLQHFIEIRWRHGILAQSFSGFVQHSSLIMGMVQETYIIYIYIDSWLICLNRKLGTPKKAYAYPACSIRFDNFPCKPFTKPWIHPWSTLPSTAWAEWQPVPWLVRCQMSPQLADCMATFGGWRIPGTHEGVSLHSFLGVGCAARLWAVSGMYAPFMLISMWEN